MGKMSGEVDYLLQNNIEESIRFNCFDVIHDIGMVQLLHQLNFRLNSNHMSSSESVPVNT